MNLYIHNFKNFNNQFFCIEIIEVNYQITSIFIFKKRNKLIDLRKLALLLLGLLIITPYICYQVIGGYNGLIFGLILDMMCLSNILSIGI